MKKIFKYPLKFIADQVIELPKNSIPLHVNMQNGKPYLWAEIVEGEDKTEACLIKVIGTGQPAVDLSQHKYLGTIHHGAFVWHIYYYKNK